MPIHTNSPGEGDSQREELARLIRNALLDPPSSEEDFLEIAEIPDTNDNIPQSPRDDRNSQQQRQHRRH